MMFQMMSIIHMMMTTTMHAMNITMTWMIQQVKMRYNTKHLKTTLITDLKLQCLTGTH